MSCSSPAERFHVVILYERLACVGKAMAAYAHLARELAGEYVPDFRVWRLDVALTPARAAEAGRDIDSAGVIIMAVNGRQPCPPAFQHWHGSTNSSGGGLPRAIYAFTEETDESDAVPIPESWINVVRRAGTQISDGIFVCDPPRDPDDGPEEEVSPTAIAAEWTNRS
ncbi:MAG: hypothetical protein PSV13_10805 [Lacunisphaera sp.]|nr:hypothetical protein [Lacunisphaera sp.]